MSNNNFDGPSFVNPKHTSHSLSNNIYQHPTYVPSVNQVRKEDQKKAVGNKKGPKGWESDEEEKPKAPKANNANSFSSFMKKSESKNENKAPEILNANSNNSHLTENTSKINAVNSVSNQNQNPNSNSNKPVSYWDEENSRKLASSILTGEYENKLIDAILVPTGISLKPSDNQMKEFIKRLKSLKRDLVYQILLERIKNYENMTDAVSIKTLTKCLYVYEAILNDKCEGILEFLKLNQNLFLGISQTFTNNKKIVELVNNLICSVNGRDPKLEKKTPTPHSNQSPITPIIKPNSGVNDLFKNQPLENDINLNAKGNLNNTHSNANNTPSLFEFANTNSQNNSNSNANQEKKTFGFLKKKNTTTEETNIDILNKAETNSSNNPSNPDLFGLISDAQSTTLKPAANTEKTGFSFIKSSSKNKEQTSGNSSNNALNSVDFNNKAAAAATKNANYDLLNEIYAQSIGENPNNNVNEEYKNVNLLTENLNNLNFNSQNNFNNQNKNSAFGGLNFNPNFNNNNYNNGINYGMNGNFNNGNSNHNYNNEANSNYANADNSGNRRSSYVAPNFEVMFANSPDMRNPLDRQSNDDNQQNPQSAVPKTNEEIDFLSELNLARKK